MQDLSDLRKKVNAYPRKLVLCQGSIARLDMVDKNLGLLQTPHLVRASEEDTVKIRVAVVFTLPWTCRYCRRGVVVVKDVTTVIFIPTAPMLCRVVSGVVVVVGVALVWIWEEG